MLILCRREGEAVFGGFNLDDDKMETTFDHHIIVKDIGHSPWSKYVELLITCPDGLVVQKTLTPGANSIKLAPTIEVFFIGTREYTTRGGDKQVSARIGFEAPRTYRLIRDNAKNLTDVLKVPADERA